MDGSDIERKLDLRLHTALTLLAGSVLPSGSTCPTNDTGSPSVESAQKPLQHDNAPELSWRIGQKSEAEHVVQGHYDTWTVLAARSAESGNQSTRKDQLLERFLNGPIGKGYT
jgi:hypothetical protein